MSPSDRIRDLRTAEGLSQAAFAARLGIPKRTIQDWESGTRVPTDYLLNLIEHAIKTGYPSDKKD